MQKYKEPRKIMLDSNKPCIAVSPLDMELKQCWGTVHHRTTCTLLFGPRCRWSQYRPGAFLQVTTRIPDGMKTFPLEGGKCEAELGFRTSVGVRLRSNKSKAIRCFQIVINLGKCPECKLELKLTSWWMRNLCYKITIF